MSKKAASSSAAAASALSAALLSDPFDERKLRPMHEAMDAGNYKAAQKLIHTALIKYKKQPVLIALLALCAAYTHQPAESRSLLGELPPLGQLDPTTFNTVTLVYRALDDVDQLIQCFETSLARAPKDEEMMHHLFFILTRTGDYARLQTTAMKMYTQGKKEKHLVWSCLNLLLQRQEAPMPAGQPDKMMQLLEMMLHRTFQYPNFPRTMQPEELLVLWRVYIHQGKWTEAVKLLESESGRAFQEKDATEYLRLKAQTLADQAKAATTDADKVRALANSNHVYSELIAQNPDDWFFLTQYLAQEFLIAERQEAMAAAKAASDAAPPAAASPSPASPDAVGATTTPTTPPPEMLTFDERVADLRSFLAELQAKCMTGKAAGATTATTATSAAGSSVAVKRTNPAGVSPLSGQAQKRGPFLAEVELEFLLWQRANRRAREDAQPMWGADTSPKKGTPVVSVPLCDTTALERAIVLYFRQFGSKTCFFYDVQKYLDQLTQQARGRMTNVCMTMSNAMVDQGNATPTEKAPAEGTGGEVKENGASSSSSAGGAAGSASASTPEAAAVRRFQLSLSVQQMMRYNYTATQTNSQTIGSPMSTVSPLAASSTSSTVAGTSSSTSSSASDPLVGVVSDRDLESLGRAMFDQFLATTKLASTILRVSTERGVGDGYLVLFAHHYFAYYLATHQKKYLLDTIAALELGLQKYSPWNYQFKLWLIRLYCHPEIGAFARALALYKSLEIKQIQHDITSHLLVEDAVRYGAIVPDQLVLGQKLLAWHANAAREDAQTTQFAYERGNYTKVLEFVEFKSRRVRSLALYQARVMQGYGGLLAIGNQANPNPQATAAQASVSGGSGSGDNNGGPPKKPEKDLVTVHAVLGQSRQELLGQYPQIVDHSTNGGGLASLVPNHDYTILTVWDGAPSALPTLMNRPAPGLWKSSFDLPDEELLQKKDDDTHTHMASRAQLQSLRFYRLTLDLLWFMLEQQSTALRTTLVAFQGVLTEMNFLDFTQPIPVQATEALVAFDDLHWRLGYLAFENSACTIETCVHDAAFLDAFGTGSPEEEQDKLEQHALRWSNLQRQYSILHFLVDSVTADVAGRFHLPPPGMGASATEDARKVVHGLKDVEDQPISAPALRDVATYAQFGLFWLALAVQMWATAVPSKKTFKKLAKKRGGGSARDLTPEEETTILEPILAVRLALASLTKAMRQSIVTLLALTKKLSARAPTTTKGGQAAAGAASAASSVLATTTFLEHKPTLLVLQAPENQAVLQTVLQHIEHSHGQTGANLYHLLHSIDAPLQAMKL